MLAFVAAATAWHRLQSMPTPIVAHQSSPTSSALSDLFQQQLLDRNLGQPGDPILDRLYEDIDQRHFGGKLPAMPVRWEPDLAKVGSLAGQTFTLEGMFGHVGTRSAILLNPSLQADQAAMQRALCHEMVHAYLYASGDGSTDHGPAFQAVLRRLSNEGAFEGVMATREEREQLKAWIDAEATRITAEKSEMARVGTAIEQERAEVDRAVNDLNVRMSGADAHASTALSDERAALVSRQAEYNRRAMEANARVEHDRADLEHFDHEVARYNLMLVYPDGFDETAGATASMTSVAAQ